MIPVVEISEVFASLSDWQSWRETAAASLASPRDIARRIQFEGFIEPLTGRRATAADIAACDNNWREGLFAFGLSSRVRAVAAVMEEKIGDRPKTGVRVFGAEALSSFALTMRGLFPRYHGTEYAADEVARRFLFPITHEDLTALTLPSESFDFAMTNDVLEHVPSIDAALIELARVLVPGGWHIGTLPFLYDSECGEVKARLERGKVVHLTKPEYHGNPIDPRGSLVFELPGWDLIDRAKAAGFSEAHMRFVASSAKGYVADEHGIFVFCARR
jgi:SAM-dependent methyltransferase